MTGDSVGTMLRQVEALLQGRAARSDCELLGAYLAQRDEDAFAALVQRHGPMVLGVCRRVLGLSDQVEDAFQATFLVLVRKANAIVPREQVGNWLYGVAYRTALHARRRDRNRRERQVEPMPEPCREDPACDAVALALLDEELARLPDHLRCVVVLCDLEGCSQRAAAAQLGLPKATLTARLMAARRLLAGRLRRRGVHEPATLAVPVSLPPALLVATLDAAAGAVPASVLTLTQGVLNAMLLVKLKCTAVVGVALLLLAGTVAGVLPARPTLHAAQEVPKLQDKDKEKSVDKDKPEKKEPTVAESLKDRLKKHEAELLKIREAMLKEVDAELKKLDDGIKAAEKAMDEAKTDRDARQKAFAALAKARGERIRVQQLRYEVDRQVNLPSAAPARTVPPDQRLGLRTGSLPGVVAAQLKLEKNKGVVVERIDAKSAAEKAGFQANDILLKVGDKAISGEAGSFRKMLGEIPADQPFDVVLLRAGKEETVKGVKIPPEASK